MAEDASPLWRAFEERAAAEAQSFAETLKRGLKVKTYEFSIDNAAVAEDTLDLELPRSRCAAIYSIDLAPEAVELAKLVFEELKQNHPRQPFTPKIVDRNRLGPCLYIGKCGGRGASVRSRLREHFLWDGDLREGTTALRLKWWLPPECWPVKVWAATLQSNDGNVGLPGHLTGFLEDLLWDERLPLLGRKGGN